MIRTPPNDEGFATVWGTFLGFHLDCDRLANLAMAQMTEREAEAAPRQHEASPLSSRSWAARLFVGWRGDGD